MATMVLNYFLGYLAIGFVSTLMAYLVYAYRLRRLIKRRRFEAIKTLFGVHYQRRAFLIAGKR